MATRIPCTVFPCMLLLSIYTKNGLIYTKNGEYFIKCKQSVAYSPLAHRKTLSYQWAHGSKMILAMGAGANNSQVAQQLGVTGGTVRCWRQRWLAVEPTLQAAEVDPEQEGLLPELLATVLSDQPRAG